MVDAEEASPLASGIPNSPQALIAMQAPPGHSDGEGVDGGGVSISSGAGEREPRGRDAKSHDGGAHDSGGRDVQSSDRPEKPERVNSPKVDEVLQLIETLDTSSFENQQIALALLRHLEELHDSVVEELRDDRFAKHSQIIAWAIDADRLLRARVLVESVDLE
jgi:hypothetical protein